MRRWLRWLIEALQERRRQRLECRWWVVMSCDTWPPHWYAMRAVKRPNWRIVSGPFDEGAAVIECDRQNRLHDAINWGPQTKARKR